MKLMARASLGVAIPGRIGCDCGITLLSKETRGREGCSGSWLNWVRGHLTNVVSGVHRFGQKSQLLPD